MKKRESQKVQRDKLQKIGELALRAFINSFPSRRRRNFKTLTFGVILASGREMASLKKNKDKKVDVLAFRESEDFPLPPYLKIKNNSSSLKTFQSLNDLNR